MARSSVMGRMPEAEGENEFGGYTIILIDILLHTNIELFSKPQKEVPALLLRGGSAVLGLSNHIRSLGLLHYRWV